MKKKVWIYDIETFSNCFSLVAKERETGKFIDFVIFEDDELEQAEDLMLWLWEKPMLVGYNNLSFDGQVIEKIWRDKVFNGRDIYAFAQDLISRKDRFDLPFKPWGFTFDQLDLMEINNYGIYGHPTSLKWLEFTTRQKSIQDLPKKHFDELEHRDIKELLRYNKKDVEMTSAFYDLCSNQIAMRNILKKKYKDDMILNQANSTIGAKIVLYSYCDATSSNQRSVKRKHTKREKIQIKDIILPYIEFVTPIFDEVKDDFEKLELKANSKGVMVLKGVYEKEIEFQDMHITYALGGIHGCVPPGIYKSSETHIIKTYDVTSMYPNIAISNKFYPEHLGEEFCKVYKNILNERKKYPKSTHKELNSAYKEAANSVYGKSNASKDNFLKDPRYTLQTTVNGQLVLSMLGERLSTIGKFIMMNTDGSEIIIPRDKEEEYQRICDEWCELTGIELEHDEYETMWVKDVNNYIAKTPSGKVKRKGMFMVYEDYVGVWNKNPSALIIPEAIQNYFINGVDPTKTITNWGNIHDFCYGIKGGKNFEYWLFEIKDNVIFDIEKYDERAIRYYVANGGRTIMKYWKGGKKEHSLDSVAGTKGVAVKMLMNTRDKVGNIFRIVKKDGVKVQESRYPDINYTFYINEAWKWIHYIEESSKPTEVEDQKIDRSLDWFFAPTYTPVASPKITKK